MGTGKTTVGRQLSRKLKMEFYDSDRVIEERTGADIPLIFELEGEAGFRNRECTLLDELTQKQRVILATGGGAELMPLGAQMVAVVIEQVRKPLDIISRDPHQAAKRAYRASRPSSAPK